MATGAMALTVSRTGRAGGQSSRVRRQQALSVGCAPIIPAPFQRSPCASPNSAPQPASELFKVKGVEQGCVDDEECRAHHEVDH